MRASRQPPSMMELCEIFRNRKEIMFNPNQPISEVEETLPASRSSCIAPTVVNERKHTTETLESEIHRPLPSTQTRRSTKTYEWPMSFSLTEDEGDFGFAEKRNELKFLREAAEVSWDEDMYAFDECDARLDPSQNQQVYRMKATNAERYRTACDKMSPPQRDEERIPRKGIAKGGVYSGNHSHRQGRNLPNQENVLDRLHCQAGYLPSQTNPRCCSNYKTSCSPNQAKLRGYSRYQASCSPNTHTRGACSSHQVQDRNEKWTSRQAIRSPVYLHQNMLNMKLEETGQAKRRNDCSDSAMTTLPPIHAYQRRATAARPHQLHRPPEEHPSQFLALGRRCGLQEVSKERNSEYCKNRRVGICKETDTTQEHRTFVRVLGKRF